MSVDTVSPLFLQVIMNKVGMPIERLRDISLVQHRKQVESRTGQTTRIAPYLREHTRDHINASVDTLLHEGNRGRRR